MKNSALEQMWTDRPQLCVSVAMGMSDVVTTEGMTRDWRDEKVLNAALTGGVCQLTLLLCARQKGEF